MGKEFDMFPCMGRDHKVEFIDYCFNTGLKLKRFCEPDSTPDYFVSFLYACEPFSIYFQVLDNAEFLERAFSLKSELDIFEIYSLVPSSNSNEDHPLRENHLYFIDDSSDRPIYVELFFITSRDRDLFNLYLKYPDTALLLATPDNFYLGRPEDRDWR